MQKLQKNNFILKRKPKKKYYFPSNYKEMNDGGVGLKLKDILNWIVNENIDIDSVYLESNCYMDYCYDDRESWASEINIRGKLINDKIELQYLKEYRTKLENYLNWYKNNLKKIESEVRKRKKKNFPSISSIEKELINLEKEINELDV